MSDTASTAKMRRTGGRSARIRAAVIRATMHELAEKGVPGLSIAAIAERAGVHPTSVYRRWKTVERLALDAAFDAAGTHVRIPDTGSLRGDLTEFLSGLDAHVRSPLGKALLSLSGLDNAESNRLREVFWKERFGDAAVIFEYGIARGEIDRETDPLFALEFAIAPIYLRALVLQVPGNEMHLARQVDATLRAFAPRV